MTLSGPAARGSPSRVGWVGAVASFLLALVFAARVLERFSGQPPFPAALGLVVAFLSLFAVAFPAQRLLARGGGWLNQAYFALQSVLVTVVFGLAPHPDVVNTLYSVLALQAALLLSRRALWVWVAWLILLTTVPLMLWIGWLPGLTIGLLPAVACIVLPALVLAHQDVDAARLQSQALVDELRRAHGRLEAYSGQADELASLEARSRLARELHDSVSQTVFSLSLNARAAQIILHQHPSDRERLRPLLERLQALAHAALADIRGLIERFRPA